ncbi:enoyl-CoA hydratase-related protein [Pseudonocardia sp. RS010]|uniref:enoyl-CoA hydratase-related protein n=1 Tax=Pseudonocardia sp. RS010 TaxID=3385979 RepID=UPI0039A0B7CB
MADDGPAITTSFDESGVLTITLDRPRSRNALTPAGVRELCAALDEADDRDDVRAVVLTAAGRAFPVGADLSGGSRTFGSKGGSGGRDWGGVLALRLFECAKPIVAAVNGDAVGPGATMLLPADARIAVDTASFGFVFTRRGIVPEACSSWFLPRVVGTCTAAQWTVSGGLIGAEEAHRAGLLTRCAPPRSCSPGPARPPAAWSPRVRPCRSRRPAA